MGQAVDHEANGGQRDPGLGDLGEFLIIFGQAPVAAKPSERSLNHPSARNDDEAGPSDAADDDQRQAKQEAREQNRQPVVDAVGEDRLEPAVQRLDPAQQGPRAAGVLNVGGMDEDAKQKAGGVDGNVAFAPAYLLGRVVASWPPFPSS